MEEADNEVDTTPDIVTVDLIDVEGTVKIETAKGVVNAVVCGGNEQIQTVNAAAVVNN